MRICRGGKRRNHVLVTVGAVDTRSLVYAKHFKFGLFLHSPEHQFRSQTTTCLPPFMTRRFVNIIVRSIYPDLRPICRPREVPYVFTEL